MEPFSSRSVRLLNTDYYQIDDQIQQVSNKVNVNTLKISYTIFVRLPKTILENFENLTDLDLSSCVLFEFENGAFRNLLSLKFINLNNNMLAFIDTDLFETNENLSVVHLKNNLLDSIPKTALKNIKNLETLDLSNNFISTLGDNCLDCSNLKKLTLTNNSIMGIASRAFYELPNLTHLDVCNNKLSYLASDIFEKSHKLQNLTMSDNTIIHIDKIMLHALHDLRSFCISNNPLNQIIYKVMFFGKNKLAHLDLSRTQISTVESSAFEHCPNLKYLFLAVCKKFYTSSIQNVTSLTQFQLVYRPQQLNNLTKYHWGYYRSLSELIKLTLVFQHANNMYQFKFSVFENLEYLHIEVLEPNKDLNEIIFEKQFKEMLKLKTVILKRLNYFFIREFNSEIGTEIIPVQHFDLTGIKNGSLNGFFFNFTTLRDLNLSFSNLTDISDNAFKFLTNLEHLNLENSKIKIITSTLFENNLLLTILNCSNCCIEIIEDFSFKNLTNLQILDLKNNNLTNRTANMLSGLSPNTLIYLDPETD